MDLTFFRAVLRKSKTIYFKMVTFSLSLALILILVFVLGLSNMYLSILSFVLFFFAFLPLLLSFELVAMRLISGYEVNYNEIYKNYKAYFAPIFKGCFGVFVTCLLSLLILDGLTSIFVYFLLLSYPELSDTFLATQNLNIFMEISAFPAGILTVFGMTILFFGYRIFSRIPVPYFNYYFGLPTPATKKMLHILKHRGDNSYKREIRTLSLPMFFLFVFLYFPLAIGLRFVIPLDFAFLIACAVSFLACAFYFPIYLTGIFLTAFAHRNSAIYFIRESLREELKMMENMENLSEEEKKKYREMYNLFEKQTLEESKKHEEQIEHPKEEKEEEKDSDNEE